MARYPFTKCRKHGDLAAGVQGAKLNLGCGGDVRAVSQGWVNLDHFEGDGVLNWDLWTFPYPFQDNSFDYVLLAHVVEHLPFVRVRRNGQELDLFFAVLSEIYRVCRDGAVVDIYTPKGTDKMFYANPEHSRPFVRQTFYGICEGREIKYVTDFRFEFVDCHVKERGFYWSWYLNAYHLMKYLKIDWFGEMDELHAILRVRKEPQAERAVARS